MTDLKGDDHSNNSTRL